MDAKAAMWLLIGSKYTTLDDVERFMGKPVAAKVERSLSSSRPLSSSFVYRRFNASDAAISTSRRILLAC
jgi:hypothetical protein